MGYLPPFHGTTGGGDPEPIHPHEASSWKAPAPTRADLGREVRDRRRRTTEGALAAIGLTVAILGFLAFAVLAPRPSIQISNVTVVEGACDPDTTSRTVTATFDLTNHGTAGGDVYILLFVDGRERAKGDFYVPAGETVRGRLSAFLPDCSYHRYSVELEIPSSPA